MNLQEIYQLAVSLGIKSDLRGEEKVRKNLAKLKITQEKMDAEQRAEFDEERLANPYADTRILYNNGREIKRILAGIDIDPQEIILAKQLGYDTVIAHHPEGEALADLGEVMNLQAEVLAQYGVPINIAQAITKERISEVARGLSPVNHHRTVDAARLLDINLICIHTPCDNLAAKFLDDYLRNREIETVGDLLAILKEVPEYKEAIKRKAGPKIFAGDKDNYTGKIALTEITGGTSNSKDIYEKMSQAGIGTIVGMHMSEEHNKEAQKYHVNVVIAGHMSSDSLGVNLLLDEIEKKGVEIQPFSGLIRIKR